MRTLMSLADAGYVQASENLPLTVLSDDPGFCVHQ